MRWQAIAADSAQGSGSISFMYMPGSEHVHDARRYAQ